MAHQGRESHPIARSSTATNWSHCSAQLGHCCEENRGMSKRRLSAHRYDTENRGCFQNHQRRGESLRESPILSTCIWCFQRIFTYFLEVTMVSLYYYNTHSMLLIVTEQNSISQSRWYSPWVAVASVILGYSLRGAFCLFTDRFPISAWSDLFFPPENQVAGQVSLGSLSNRGV